jgi:hypothetical protein
MRYLLVGKTGLFDTLGVAAGLLDKADINTSPLFGDLALEKSKSLIKLGEDRDKNEIFVVGFKEPHIVERCNQDLQTLGRIDDNKRLKVIPVNIKGENATWLLVKLAYIPWIGTFFLNWAKSRSINRSAYLLSLGKNLRIENNADVKNKKELMWAAKPYRNGGNP